LAQAEALYFPSGTVFWPTHPARGVSRHRCPVTRGYRAIRRREDRRDYRTAGEVHGVGGPPLGLSPSAHGEAVAHAVGRPVATGSSTARRRRGSCGRGAHRRCQIQERDRSRSAQDETQAEGSRPVHIAGGQHTPCEPRRGLRGWEAARVWRARRGTPGPSAGGSGKRLAYGAVFFSAFAFVAWPAG
jgi:hypothetical protein